MTAIHDAARVVEELLEEAARLAVSAAKVMLQVVAGEDPSSGCAGFR